MSYTVADVVRLVRKNARNALSSAMYTTQDIHDAFFAAADEWSSLVKPNRVATTLALTQGSATVPAFPATWTPENTMQIDISLAGTVLRPGLAFVSMNQLREKQWEYGGTIPTARPTMIAVPDASATQAGAVLDTLPDAPYAITLWRWTPLVTWTSGQAALTATLGTANNIARVDVLEGGYYATAPTLTLTGGTGSGATFSLTMSGDGHSIASASVTAPGTAYTGTLLLYVNGEAANGVSVGFTDEQIRVICMAGAPFYLQRNEPENTERCAMLYEEFLAKAQQFSSRNIGGKGALEETKDDPPSRPNDWFYPRAQ